MAALLLFHAINLALLGAATLLGLAANLPYFPPGDGPYQTFPADAPVVWLGRLHAPCMLAFSVLALWEVTRGWRDDLVQARRTARRWVAMGIGLYAGLAELAQTLRTPEAALRELINQRLGVTPTEYRAGARLGRAAPPP